MKLGRGLALAIALVCLVVMISGCATNYRESDPFGYYRRAGDFDTGPFPSQVYYNGYYGRPWARY
jgi:hypothetical protein